MDKTVKIFSLKIYELYISSTIDGVRNEPLLYTFCFNVHACTIWIHLAVAWCSRKDALFIWNVLLCLSLSLISHNWCISQCMCLNLFFLSCWWRVLRGTHDIYTEHTMLKLWNSVVDPFLLTNFDILVNFFIFLLVENFI